jgi:hypothetical protein
VNELALAEISTLEAANRYPTERFMPNHNDEFARLPADPTPAPASPCRPSARKMRARIWLRIDDRRRARVRRSRRASANSPRACPSGPRTERTDHVSKPHDRTDHVSKQSGQLTCHQQATIAGAGP